MSEHRTADELVAQAERLLEATQAEVARLLERAEEIRNRPEDDFENGTVLVWTQRGGSTGVRYTYAALKVGGRWYITGPRSPQNGIFWPRLLNLIETGVNAGMVGVALREVEVRAHVARRLIPG